MQLGFYRDFKRKKGDSINNEMNVTVTQGLEQAKECGDVKQGLRKANF